MQRIVIHYTNFEDDLTFLKMSISERLIRRKFYKFPISDSQINDSIDDL